MSRMLVGEVWAEMARRKLRFHANEDWRSIRLWGLFQWNDVSGLLENGQLVTHMKKENRTIWVRPSEEAYHKHIKPLLERYSLEMLTTLAGW